jgi:hypothetical protein
MKDKIHMTISIFAVKALDEIHHTIMIKIPEQIMGIKGL